jgi:hypothetical protein
MEQKTPVSCQIDVQEFHLGLSCLVKVARLMYMYCTTVQVEGQGREEEDVKPLPEG